MGAKRLLSGLALLVLLIVAFSERSLPRTRALSASSGSAFDTTLEHPSMAAADTSPPTGPGTDASPIPTVSPSPSSGTTWVGIAGHVTDLDGNPLENICISAHDVMGAFAARSTDIVAKTDRAGLYIFEHPWPTKPVPGSFGQSGWDVEPWDCGDTPLYQSPHGDYHVNDPNKDNFSEDVLFRKAMLIDDKTFLELDMKMDGGGSITGTVVDSNDAPIPGVCVNGYNGYLDSWAQNDPSVLWLYSVRTDSLGRFTISGLAPASEDSFGDHLLFADCDSPYVWQWYKGVGPSNHESICSDPTATCDPMNPDYYRHANGVGVKKGEASDIGRVVLDAWVVPSPSAT